MASAPLGQRAHIKGPQYDKRVLVKAPSPTFHILVRLPSYILKHIRGRHEGRGGPPLPQTSLLSGSALRPLEYFSASDTSCAPSPAGSFSSVKQSQARTLLAVDVIPIEELLRGMGGDEGAENPAAYSTAYRDVIQVVIPSNATIRTAIECILQRCDYTARRADDFLLYQCFADFTIDDNRRGLYGDSPIAVKMILQFPYYLTLQTVPLVTVREKIALEDEPEQRRSVVNELKLFTGFALGYQDLLRKILTQQQLLYGRERETRKAKLLEESLYRFDLRRFLILRSEKEARHALGRQMDISRALCCVDLEASISHLRLWPEMMNEFLVGLRALKQEFSARHTLEVLLNTWRRRLGALHDLAEDLTMESLRRKRDTYTDSRIASGIHEANRRGLEPVLCEVLLASLPLRFRRVLLEEFAQQPGITTVCK
jgi:hypothetical protein